MTHDVLELFGATASSRAGIRDRVLLLRAVDYFVGLDEEGLTALAEHARNRSYKKGEVIVAEGAPPEAIHVVVEGQVTLSRKLSPATMSTGSGFGVLTALAGAPSRSAIAATDTRTLEIPVAAFEVALEENVSLFRNAMRMMGQTLLRNRGSLPADPKNPPPVELGARRDRAKTITERLVEHARGPVSTTMLVDLFRHVVEFRVPAGHVFWSAGDPSSSSLHIDYGRVRCTAPDGRFLDVGANFDLGVMDIWAAQPRSYEARAETEVIGYTARAEDFLVVLEMHVRDGLAMLRSLARRMLDAE